MKIIILALFLPIGAAAKTIEAKAILESKNGSTVSGSVKFVQKKNNLEISYDISGLAKNQKHGFHVHENGDCSSPDGKSAGPHYMKIAEEGGTSLDNPHAFAGDLPEIQADKNGKAKGKFVTEKISLNGNNVVVGRAVIVHGGPDDITQKSAPRLACGVLKLK